MPVAVGVYDGGFGVLQQPPVCDCSINAIAINIKLKRTVWFLAIRTMRECLRMLANACECLFYFHKMDLVI